jgi:predicted SAM-dependent methyltransferase
MPDAPKAMVNLGCGSRLHGAWLNYDLFPVAPGVKAADFINGIPLPDRSASCVYHSHVLEHLPLPVARRFLTECFRVLAPGGVLRVVVPDFEQSARDYIALLDHRRRGEALSKQHRWLLVEMFDQMVRTTPGGEMTRMLRTPDVAVDEFAVPRLGSFGRGLVESLRRPAGGRGRFERVVGHLERWLPRGWGRAIGETMFRRRGEIHLWMYDELFLGDMLRELGYEDVRRLTHGTSRIPRWQEYGLDAEPDGSPYKGTSLYVEAKRPEGA